MIPVEPAERITGHDTPEAAIAAAKADPLQPKAREDATAFAGRTFVDGWHAADEWVLEFSGGVWLRVFIENARVAWAVARVRPDGNVITGPVVLEWPSGRTSRIDPASLVASRRGADFWQFWVNDMGFHVYLRRKLILCFSPVRRRDTGQIILHVWEDD
jgi:hypothetical protein